jgi:hypothetical protein
VKRRLGALAATIVISAIAVVGCGKTNDEIPTGPGVSRAEPTGTVNTTVPASTTTKG